MTSCSFNIWLKRLIKKKAEKKTKVKLNNIADIFVASYILYYMVDIRKILILNIFVTNYSNFMHAMFVCMCFLN